MGRMVDIAKAARTLGVSRTNLQKLIRSGDLLTFEGKVDMDQLQSKFPALVLQPQSLLEKTKIIRDVAYSRRIDQYVKPSQEDLENQLRHLKVELSVARTQAFESRKILEDMVGMLGNLQQTSTLEQKDTLGEINLWLASRMTQKVKVHR